MLERKIKPVRMVKAEHAGKRRGSKRRIGFQLECPKRNRF